MKTLVKRLLSRDWKLDNPERTRLAADLLAAAGSARPALPDGLDASPLVSGRAYPHDLMARLGSDVPNWAIDGLAIALPDLLALCLAAPETYRFIRRIHGMFGVATAQPDQDSRVNGAKDADQYALSVVADRCARIVRFSRAFGVWRHRLSIDRIWSPRELDLLGRTWVAVSVVYVLCGDRPYRAEAALEVLEPVLFGDALETTRFATHHDAMEWLQYCEAHAYEALECGQALLDWDLVDRDSLDRLKVLHPGWVRAVR